MKGGVDMNKAYASGGLMKGSPKPKRMTIREDLFGSPARDAKQREEGRKNNAKYSGGY